MNYNTILAITFLAIISFIIIKMLFGPLKAFIKLIFSCTISTMGLLLFNFAGQVIGLHIGLNLVTIFSVAILGIPGVALLLFLQVIFNT